MIFPDGTIKEGYFEHNVYKGPKSSSQDATPTSKDMMRSTRASS